MKLLQRALRSLVRRPSCTVPAIPALALGMHLEMDAAPYTIHGVGPEGLTFPTEAGIFRCQGILSPDYYERRENRNRSVIARLEPGVSLKAGERELARDRRRRRLDRVGAQLRVPEALTGWVRVELPVWES